MVKENMEDKKGGEAEEEQEIGEKVKKGIIDKMRILKENRKIMAKLSSQCSRNWKKKSQIIQKNRSHNL